MFAGLIFIRTISISNLFVIIFVLSSLQAIGQKKADVPTKSGFVSVCKEIDDDWKCIGESASWEANKKFNVLFINPVAVGVDFVGIIFHRQLPDGRDGDFLYEFQQHIGADNRKYATIESPFYLPSGTYTLYITAWDKRDSLYHKGNFTDYFAKMTLKVR